MVTKEYQSIFTTIYIRSDVKMSGHPVGQLKHLLNLIPQQVTQRKLRWPVQVKTLTEIAETKSISSWEKTFTGIKKNKSIVMLRS